MTRAFLSVVLLASLLIIPACAAEESSNTPEPAAPAATDKAPTSAAGMWSGDWGPSESHRNDVTLELKMDGDHLMGTVNPGEHAVALTTASYEADSGMIKMEADAKGHSGDMVHYTIEGKVEGDSMMGTWMHGDQKGDFKLTKKP
ncbi:MAG TPA: hypothetical protein VFY29_00475 [Terriglobia bacterium]|nr:hypothetical protein [Terriglobia bacterium]